MSPVSIRSLVRETALYGISGVVARSMGLLLLPVLSNLLPPEEFGHYKLAYVLIGLLQLFLVFGMGNSLVRYLIGAADKRLVFSSHFWPLLAVSTLGSLAVFLSAGSLSAVYFAEPLPGDAGLIRLAALILWFDSLSTLPYSLLRAENRPLAYVSGMSLQVVIYAILVVYLLGARHSGMTGVLIANAVGSGAVLIFFIPLLKNNLSAAFDSRAFRIYFAFGFPIIFSSLGKNLLDLADRWILDRLMGAAVVAYYSAGYQLAAVANLAVAAFTLAWKPFLVRAAAEKGARETFARIMTLTIVALCLLFLLISFFADNLVKLSFFGYHLIQESYWPGLRVIPVVMVSYIFYGAYINLSVGCDLKGRTDYYAWTTGAAALFNIAANFILIPPLGMLGSAWATLFAYLLQVALLYYLTRRLYPVTYEWAKLLRLGVLTGLCFAGAVLSGSSAPAELLFSVLFLAGLFAFRIMDRQVLRGLFSLLRRTTAGEE